MSESLLRSAGKAAAWSAIGNSLGLIGSLVSLVVIARLLDPQDFGIYGFILITLSIPSTIACDSLNVSLIQRPDLTSGHSNSIFILSMVFAGIFFTGIFFGADQISAWYGIAELTPYLKVMAFSLFLGAVSAVPAAHLQRELKFKQVAIVDTLSIVIGAIVGIILAISLRDAWALVGMEMTRRFVRMVAFSFFARWLPSLSSTWSDMMELASFNIASVGLKLVNEVEKSLVQLLVGIFLGPAALGMFNLARRVHDQAIQALVAPFNSVSIPVASKSQNDFPTLHRALKAAIRLSSFIAYPAFLGAVAIAPLAVPVVFGEKWIPAIATIQISLLIGLRWPMAAFNGGVLNGIGRPGILLKSILLADIVLLLIPFAAQHSLEAVMSTVLLQRMVGWLLISWIVYKLVGFSIKEQIIAGSTALIASTMMAASVWLTMIALPAEWDDSYKLIVLIVVGIVTYPLSLFIIAPKATIRLCKAAPHLARGDTNTAMSIVRAR